MNKLYLNISLYISSFIPLYFLIIVKELIDIVNGNLSFNITNSVMLSINLVLIILGSISIFYLYKKTNYQTVEIKSYKNITRENFLPYFPLFVLFALAFELEFISMAVVYVLILVIIGIVYVKNEMFYINPLLNIIGFSLYEVTLENGKKLRVFMQKKPTSANILTNGFLVKSGKVKEN